GRRPAVFDPGALMRFAQGGMVPVSPTNAGVGRALAEGRARHGWRENLVAGDILGHGLVPVPGCRRARAAQALNSHRSLMPRSAAHQTQLLHAHRAGAWRCRLAELLETNLR